MMKIGKATLKELHETLVINCDELVSDIFLLECLIQYNEGRFTVDGSYSDKDYELILHRVTSYVEQHLNEISTANTGILKRLQPE